MPAADRVIVLEGFITGTGNSGVLRHAPPGAVTRAVIVAGDGSRSVEFTAGEAASGAVVDSVDRAVNSAQTQAVFAIATEVNGLTTIGGAVTGDAVITAVETMGVNLTGTAEAAAQDNRIRQFGRRISLDPLVALMADLVADLAIHQMVFDNGRKAAKRDPARADVDSAAVPLVEDGNTRVFHALSHNARAEQ